jgi:hypothetical protein
MFLEAGKADNFADVVRSGEIMNALQAILAEIPIEINSDPLLMAERELAAFGRAVRELFGSEQERQSIEDWMQELESMDRSKREANTDWRHLTIAAAVRLSNRVCLLR